MKCNKCGYESPAQFIQCPRCGTLQNVVLTTSPYTVKRKRTGGETAAIVTAVVVSIISLIAAFFIFVFYISYLGTKTLENYGIDSYDDFDSNEYDDELDDFFKDYYGKDGKDNKSRYNSENPAGRNTPIGYKAELYSFSEGEIKTGYEVSMVETYRGEAALKMLEGAALPDYDKDESDVYLVKFSIKITEQDKDAIVVLPASFPAAYPSNTVSIFSSGYDALDSLDYTNKYSLISKGENVETYIAFITSKNDDNPCIRWDMTEDKVFRDDGEAITDPSKVESGVAVDIPTSSDAQSETPDESSSDDTSSD